MKSKGFATIILTTVATVVGINITGFVVAGESPGYGSAQGSASFTSYSV